MFPQMRTFLPNAIAAPRTELVLRLADGSPWRLVMAPGCERFIGYYPRVPGFETGGDVLSYRRIGAVAL